MNETAGHVVSLPDKRMKSDGVMSGYSIEKQLNSMCLIKKN